MAKDQLPPAKERRRLLAESAGGLGPVGRQFLAQGRWGEALECLATAGDRQGLEDLAGQALMAGDLFCWLRAGEALGCEPSAEELTRLQERAQAAGKLAFAAAAQALLHPERDQDQDS